MNLSTGFGINETKVYTRGVSRLLPTRDQTQVGSKLSSRLLNTRNILGSDFQRRGDLQRVFACQLRSGGFGKTVAVYLLIGSASNRCEWKYYEVLRRRIVGTKPARPISALVPKKNEQEEADKSYS